MAPVASIYGYIPTEWVGIFFIALFGLSTLAHVIQLGYYRKWALIFLAIGGIGETIGWVGRLISHSNPMDRNAFLIQIICLIMAPAFYQAAIYIILGYIVKQAGREYSRLKPFQYSIIFLICDLASLVTQAIGGAMAASAKNSETAKQRRGSNIMLGGIVFQLFCMCIFILLALEVAWRLHSAKRGTGRFTNIQPQEQERVVSFLKKIRWVAVALVVSTVCMFVRGIYRVAELSEGWSGPIITNENYFIVLDATLMIITQTVFNIFYPAKYLDGRSSKTQPDNEYPLKDANKP